MKLLCFLTNSGFRITEAGFSIRPHFVEDCHVGKRVNDPLFQFWPSILILNGCNDSVNNSGGVPMLLLLQTYFIRPVSLLPIHLHAGVAFSIPKPST